MVHKSFADNFYFMLGLFPENIEKNLGKPGWYIRRIRGVYSTLSTDPKDAFSMLGRNMAVYVATLNHMRDNYLHGNFQRKEYYR